MIASFLHNFIFIKTRKTAGTTVELVLAPLCGPDDVVSPLGWSEEKSRSKEGMVCRNFLRDPQAEAQVREGLASSSRKMQAQARTLLRNAPFYSHMTATEMRDLLPAEFWPRAFKFTVERHPYEKVVSRAYFRYDESRHGTFADFLDFQVRRRTYSDFESYSIGGDVVIDEFLRQEKLEEDLKRLARRLDLRIPEALPQSKSKRRVDRRPAREILSEEQKAIVRDVCRREFELLGYEP
ncbi:MAG: hypothetical protein JO261_05425 [Alphaproteobacteria bacterium]|nr:hypothetical protein [Alphaproteobacteria bacterium]MBV9693122.1 hypothetical protein [Alphaproteobacteria bacterium]